VSRRRAASRGTFTLRALSALLHAHINALPGARLCLAFSGGRDSTALLSALAALRSRAGFELRAVHVNHQLQPGAAAWASAALAMATRLRVPARVLKVRVATRGASIEASARAARYHALREQLGSGEWLLTAHHQEDQLETLLLQLLRGAGLAGLAAMPAALSFGRGRLLRPLLTVSRAALADYARRQRLAWAEDSSNQDPRFDRNFLRATVLPPLLQRWPAAATTVSRAAAHLAEAQGLLEQQADRQLEPLQAGNALSIRALRRLEAAEQRNVLRRWFKRLALPAPDTARLTELQQGLLVARHDAMPLLAWPGVEVRRGGDALHAMAPLPALPVPRPWHWQRRRILALAGVGTLSLVDDPHGDIALERLPLKLQVAFRHGGERLTTTNGHKPLKNLLQESELAAWLRGRLPLLYAGERLLAVAGVWRAPMLAPAARERRRARLVFASDFE
jgi:tRNA(Ile)-lysidine synthase